MGNGYAKWDISMDRQGGRVGVVAVRMYGDVDVVIDKNNAPPGCDPSAHKGWPQIVYSEGEFDVRQIVYPAMPSGGSALGPSADNPGAAIPALAAVPDASAQTNAVKAGNNEPAMIPRWWKISRSRRITTFASRQGAGYHVVSKKLPDGPSAPETLVERITGVTGQVCILPVSTMASNPSTAAAFAAGPICLDGVRYISLDIYEKKDNGVSTFKYVVTEAKPKP